MQPEQYAASIPYWKHIGMELLEVGDGHAAVSLSVGQEHSSNDERLIAHGGVIASLVDSAAGMAATAANGAITPTIDMRIDYLAPVTTDLRADAEIVRHGESTSVVSCEVYDTEGTHVATARSVFKTGGGDGETPWSRE